MRLRRLILVASAVAAWVTLTALAAAAEPLADLTTQPALGPWSLAPGEYYAELSGSTLKTDSYFNDDSKRTAAGYLFQDRRVRAGIEMGWKKRWSLQLSLPLTTVTTRDPAGRVTSNAGLEDLGIGLRYRISNGRGASSLQLRWEAPAGYNRTLPMPVGDGLQKLSAALRFGGPAGASGFWQLGAGYRMGFLKFGANGTDETESPAQWNWANHVTVDAAVAHWFRRVQVAALYGGQFAASSGYAHEIDQHVAGPRVTYRADARLDVFAGSWHTPAGRNAWHADAYYAGVAWKATKLARNQGFLGSDAR